MYHSAVTVTVAFYYMNLNLTKPIHVHINVINSSYKMYVLNACNIYIKFKLQNC